MCTLKLIILLQLCAVQAIWANAADGENLSHAEAAALPYSLKTSNSNKNDERYKLLAMNSLNDQTADHELVETNNRNNLQKRRSGDAWDRLSLQYKTQLSQVNPVDDFGYYNPHSVAPHTFPADVSHFGGVGTAPSLPLALMLIPLLAD
ncbi:unnamed protein product [Ceratitis capitata]|uniref:(Mediterranean fruit fly) hypothetical protein n=1 Tax=Ceratitis capitata TaxID=7213 RepID=A0A811V1I8_CERCA|nr:unnamed protein product [Ceratitis capitata]